MVEIAPTTPAATAPEGMVAIPAGEFDFKVTGVEIEGDTKAGVDVQYPWESRRAAITATAWPCRPSTSTATRSPTPSSRQFLDATRLPAAGRPQFPARLGRRRPARRLGQQAGHLGVARGRARLRGLGRQAPAARMGMAVRGAGHRRPPVSLGRPGAKAARRRPTSGRELLPPADVDAHPTAPARSA